MSLVDMIRVYPGWNQLKELYERLRIEGAKPVRLVCHPEHTSQAELAIRSMKLDVAVDPRPDCPREKLYFEGDDA